MEAAFPVLHSWPCEATGLNETPWMPDLMAARFNISANDLMIDGSGLVEYKDVKTSRPIACN
eukprot:7351752-Karenia_brevis.AAC.1